MEINVTRHAAERFFERFGGLLSPEARKAMRGCDARPAIREVGEYIRTECEETRSLLNDTAFMATVLEKYGYGRRYRFFAGGDAVFVGTENHGMGRIDVVTVVRSVGTSTAFARCRPRKRFGRPAA